MSSHKGRFSAYACYQRTPRPLIRASSELHAVEESNLEKHVTPTVLGALLRLLREAQAGIAKRLQEKRTSLGAAEPMLSIITALVLFLKFKASPKGRAVPFFRSLLGGMDVSKKRRRFMKQWMVFLSFSIGVSTSAPTCNLLEASDQGGGLY